MKKRWLGLLLALCLLVTCLCAVTAIAEDASASPSGGAVIEDLGAPSEEPAGTGFADGDLSGSLVADVSGGGLVADAFKMGDANGDGSIDMKDVLAIRRFIANLDAEIDERAAVCNGDGDVDMKDVLLLRQYIAGWDVTLWDGETDDASDVSEVSGNSDEPDTSDGERAPYIYGDDGEPYINFIDDPNCSLGVWWWNTGDGNNASLREKYLSFLGANGTTQIYYYCAYDILKPAGRNATYTFAKAAAEYGMTVAPILDDFDMAGSKQYAHEQLSAFKTGYEVYQSEHPDAPLDGFHCDIEPHQMNGKGASLETLTQAQLQGYADYFLDELQPLRAAGIPVEVDLNCQWNRFGGENITYGGYTGIYNVIAHYVDSMCLMAYRDTAEDILALGEIAFDAAKDAGTRLVFAVESGAYPQFNQPYEEFAQEDKEYMYEEFAKVYEALKDDHPAGGYGLAVHQHRTWYELKKRA